MKRIICVMLVLIMTSCTSGLDLIQSGSNPFNAFEEGLNGFEEFVPDLLPSQVIEGMRKYQNAIDNYNAYVNQVHSLIELGIIGKPSHYSTYDGKIIQYEEELDDDRKTKNQAIAIYTTVGGALGAGVGQLMGKDTKSTLYGTGFGLLGGYLLGRHKGELAVADKKRLEKQKKLLQYEISQARLANQKTKAYNSNLRDKIKKLRRLKKSDLERNLKNAKEKYVEAKGLCEMSKMKLKELEELQSQIHSASGKLDLQIAKLRKEIFTLEKQTDQLASIDKRIRV